MLRRPGLHILTAVALICAAGLVSCAGANIESAPAAPRDDGGNDAAPRVAPEASKPSPAAGESAPAVAAEVPVPAAPPVELRQDAAKRVHGAEGPLGLGDSGLLSVGGSAGVGSGVGLGSLGAGKVGSKTEGREFAIESARAQAKEELSEKRKATASTSATKAPTTTSDSSPDLRPDPAATGGTFVHAGTNPFIDTVTDARSTFAIDVDTGSFTFARRFLRQGQVPPEGAVRVEEWVNAMHYSYEGPAKTSSVPFSVLVQGAPSPIAKNTHLVRIALQGKRVSKAERGPTSLVFLADVSGSMDAADKLPLARDALHLLVDELRDDDSVAITTYAGETRLALASTMIKGNKARIHAAIESLHSGGGTNMGSGMELAYREAGKNLGGGRSARVVVLSDGDVNIGRLSHQDILKAIRGYVSEGVMMSTVGFGTGNYNDNLMEQLADAGNGNYSYIDSKKTAERVFVQELNGTLETIAQNVKIQVEWNKDIVTSYRLVGYENRDVADVDFRNDKKDAGEIGAGHAVTALYELHLSSSSPSANLGTVRVRAQKPRGSKAEEIAVAITGGSLRERPNDLDSDAQAALAVALAAEILRGSPYAEGRTLGEAASLLREAATGPHAAERLELARELVLVEPRVARR